MWFWHTGWWLALVPLLMIVACIAIFALMCGGRRAGRGGCCIHDPRGAERH